MDEAAHQPLRPFTIRSWFLLRKMSYANYSEESA
jgi:hypothetical protein